MHLCIYNGSGDVPVMVLSTRIGERVNTLVERIAELNGSQIPNPEKAADSLLNTLLIYCESKCNVKVNKTKNRHEVNILARYKQVVAGHFPETHQVSRYAEMMHLSPKYLNQVMKRVMGTSAKSIIQEKLLIKACRDLKFSSESIKGIANKLGFSEP
ncbi:MAG: AraC family transcriptional regulator [Bacteroides sp.]|jgi:AraC-like DNA-binding protein|nr:AraC family transcriptional regulator [Bacteroides sp.]